MAVERRRCLLHLAAHERDAVRQEPVGDKVKIRGEIDIARLHIHDLPVAVERRRDLGPRAVLRGLQLSADRGERSEIRLAPDIIYRERARPLPHSHACILYGNLAAERILPRASRLDILDVPRSVRALCEQGRHAAQRHLIDGRGGIFQHSKQAEMHPRLRGARDAFRLLVIDGNIMKGELMERGDLDAAHGDLRAERRGSEAPRLLPRRLHEGARLNVIPKPRAREQAKKKDATYAAQYCFPLHRDIPLLESRLETTPQHVPAACRSFRKPASRAAHVAWQRLSARAPPPRCCSPPACSHRPAVPPSPLCPFCPFCPRRQS